MSIDDDTIARAVDEVGALIDALSDPDKMSREEAFAFYDALTEEIDVKRRALKEVSDG